MALHSIVNGFTVVFAALRWGRSMDASSGCLSSARSGLVGGEAGGKLLQFMASNSLVAGRQTDTQRVRKCLALHFECGFEFGFAFRLRFWMRSGWV